MFVYVYVTGRRCSGHAGTGSGAASAPDGGEVDDAAAADGGGSTLAGAGGKLPGKFSLFSPHCVCLKDFILATDCWKV